MPSPSGQHPPTPQCLVLWLPGYLTPSLNQLLGKNHWILTKHKKQAKAALSSASHGTELDSLTLTTCMGELSRSLMLLDTWGEFVKMTQPASSLSSVKRKSRKKRPAPKS